MWFARLFGGRAVQEDDEPARFSAPESAQAAQPVKRVTPFAQPTAKPSKSGFDPYNSGAFQREKDWERVFR
jgi:hypothetical protein